MAAIISNASPLITLSMVGELGLLHEVFEEVSISSEVHAEVVVRGEGKPGAADVDAAPFNRVFSVKDAGATEKIRMDHNLGLGEASTLALALETRAPLVLVDERLARQAGKTLGLRVAGTLRVMELAYEKGKVQDLPDLYKRVLATNARISPDLFDESLVRNGLPPLG